MNIKNNKRIHGIKIKVDSGEEYEETISQYADDANIWSLYEKESLNQIIYELEQFYASTGLRVNYDKSIMYRAGSLQDTEERMYLDKKFRWSNDKIDTLGMIIGIDDSDLESLNYETILKKANNIVTSWAQRNITLLGKIEIINSLVGSLFVYKMQQLPLMSKKVIAEITMLITKFVWNGRKPKIQNSILTAEKQLGGRKDKDIKIKH